MSLLPDDSFKQLSNTRKEFDQMFSNFPFDLSFFDKMISNLSGMRVDVHETATEVIATCDIPGLKKDDDIQINVDQQMLSIRGSIHKTMEVKEDHMFRQESSMSGFQRSIPLPSPVSRDGAKATYRNGVLEVRMQKIPQLDVKKVDIDFY